MRIIEGDPEPATTLNLRAGRRTSIYTNKVPEDRPTFLGVGHPVLRRSEVPRIFLSAHHCKEGRIRCMDSHLIDAG